MSRTGNANATLVSVTAEETVGVRKTTQVLAVTVFAALLAVAVASAATRPPVQSAQVKQAAHALEVRGQALNRIYHLGPYASTSAQAVRALEVRGQALDRIFQVRPRPDDRTGSRGIGSTHTTHLLSVRPDNRGGRLGISAGRV